VIRSRDGLSPVLLADADLLSVPVRHGASVSRHRTGRSTP
jgi:hypothetical protein